MGDLKVKLTDEEIRELRDAAEAVDLSAGWHGEEGLYTDTGTSLVRNIYAELILDLSTVHRISVLVKQHPRYRNIN